MDRYQRVEKPRAETPIDENEIRITSQGRMRSYITYALTLLQEKGSDVIVFKAMGRAINKTVTMVELIKRRVVGLHQITCIGSTDITDTWEPLEEGLLPLETTRHVSMIVITLSKNELDKSAVGYQSPLPAELVKPSADFDFEGEGSPNGRGRGRGGRGRGRGGRGNGFMAPPEYEDDGYDRNRAYPRGRGRGRGRGFHGRGRGGYNGPQADTQQDGGYNQDIPFQGRGNHDRVRGGYNGPQSDTHQDGGYNQEAPFQGRGFRNRGRGGYNGPRFDAQQDGGYNQEAPYQGRGDRGRGRGGYYNGPQYDDAQRDVGYNQEAPYQGRSIRGHGRGGYNGPQYDDGGYNQEAPFQGRGRGRGRGGGRGRGRGGYRSNGPVPVAAGSA